MALSVRLEAAVETRLEEEARKLGISKSEFVKDALERTLGIKNPAELLSQARSSTPMGNPKASANVRSSVRKKLGEEAQQLMLTLLSLYSLSMTPITSTTTIS